MKDPGYFSRGTQLQKQVVTMIKEAQATFVKSQFVMYRKDSKKLWKSNGSYYLSKH